METDGQNGFRFYNAGNKVDEQWSFSISPTSAGFNQDDRGAHSLGKFNVIAPKESWFFVPLEIQSGNETIRVNFPEDMRRKYGPRGIVMLDPRHKPELEDPDKPLETYPVAPTEELCMVRAEALWGQFLERICSAHFEDVQNAMANGMRPRAASGFTIYALKAKGYRDSAADYLKGMKDGQHGNVAQAGASPEMIGVLRGISEQNKLMTSLVLAIASGSKVDPELLKALTQPGDSPAAKTATAASMTPPPNAGVLEVEGVPASSLEQRINNRTVGYETAATKVGGKHDRAKAAAKEL